MKLNFPIYRVYTNHKIMRVILCDTAFSRNCRRICEGTEWIGVISKGKAYEKEMDRYIAVHGFTGNIGSRV